jgi:hypothetical protein
MGQTSRKTSKKREKKEKVSRCECFHVLRLLPEAGDDYILFLQRAVDDL